MSNYELENKFTFNISPKVYIMYFDKVPIILAKSNFPNLNLTFQTFIFLKKLVHWFFIGSIAASQFKYINNKHCNELSLTGFKLSSLKKRNYSSGDKILVTSSHSYFYSQQAPLIYSAKLKSSLHRYANNYILNDNSSEFGEREMINLHAYAVINVITSTNVVID